MKRLPIGIQDFRKLRTEGYLYVDKTQYIHDLAIESTPFFLSRPRRFGKSLTVSTLKYLFQGEKDLFTGTWIENRWDWKPYPVIHLSMTQVDTTTPERLQESLFSVVKETSESFGLTLHARWLKDAFRGLFPGVCEKTGERIVFLIDEYDKPILDHLHQPDQARQIREVLRSFYSTIKDADPYLRFVFITGITRFTKAGIFSTMNNLVDLSTRKAYATLLGYTRDELELFFAEHIDIGVQETGMNRDTLLQRMCAYYDGFSFDGRKSVFNPFSMLNFFSEFVFKHYWFESGSPFFLAEYVKQHEIEIDSILYRYILEGSLSAYEIEKAPPESFLVQSGYLTFKRYDSRKGYLLDFPNQEVKDAFSQLIILHSYQLESRINDAIRDQIIDGLDSRNFDRVFQQMRRAFANIPYSLYLKRQKQVEDLSAPESLERYYHAIILTLLWACGTDIRAEEATSLGRSDLVLRYDQDVYILELKQASPEEAIAQIREKNYGEKYKGSHLCLVGIEIDSEKRNLKRFLLERGP